MMKDRPTTSSVELPDVEGGEDREVREPSADVEEYHKTFSIDDFDIGQSVACHQKIFTGFYNF